MAQEVIGQRNCRAGISPPIEVVQMLSPENPSNAQASSIVRDRPVVEYLSVATTAKLVRTALKTQFPRIKFTVRSRSYSGGASIDVAWTDGPCAAAVEAIT